MAGKSGNLASFWQRGSGVGKGFGWELSKRQRLFSCSVHPMWQISFAFKILHALSLNPLSFSISDVTLELPFTLSHPKPPDETPPSTPAPQVPTEEAAGRTLGGGRGEGGRVGKSNCSRMLCPTWSFRGLFSFQRFYFYTVLLPVRDQGFLHLKTLEWKTKFSTRDKLSTPFLL